MLCVCYFSESVYIGKMRIFFFLLRMSEGLKMLMCFVLFFFLLHLILKTKLTSYFGTVSMRFTC